MYSFFTFVNNDKGASALLFGLMPLISASFSLSLIFSNIVQAKIRSTTTAIPLLWINVATQGIAYHKILFVNITNVHCRCTRQRDHQYRRHCDNGMISPISLSQSEGKV